MRGSLKELVDELKSRYESIERFDDGETFNRYETGYEETERDGTHISVMVSIYLYQVSESPLVIDIEELTK